MNIIIITGASSGIGMEFAFQMDEHFDSIDEFWLVARSYDKMKEISKALRHKVRIMTMDITNEAQLDRLEDEIREQNAVVRMLVNCAGYGIMGDFAKQDISQELGMIRLNCEALTGITHRLIPYMKKGSRIIQMASSAAFVPQPDFAVYAASKSYVLSFSSALGQELKSKGIYVTSVCPGPVDTPFFDRAEKTGTTLNIKKYTMVDAYDVVKLALRDSYHKKSVSVCSMPIKAFRLLTKFAPHSALLNIMSLMKKIELY
jgi:short-subunit dehydrogenase